MRTRRHGEALIALAETLSIGIPKNGQGMTIDSTEEHGEKKKKGTRKRIARQLNGMGPIDCHHNSVTCGLGTRRHSSSTCSV